MTSAPSTVSSKTMLITDKRFITLLLIMLAAWGAIYHSAIVSMEAIWSRSDTFAHGYFILPISLWLLWRDKDYLLSSPIQSTWLPLPLLAISLFVGLFSYAADINVLMQLSAVTSLIFLLWALVGHHLAWRYKFALVYLLFSVPMGENLIPWLQDVTAWFTVSFLKLNGIPVYVDGLYIQIPTGMFEVAVACSGIRYLIASAAVGALYAYLTYTKLSKQIIFFVFALTLPILANGIRAYGIVAIAYYSDMKYATGADHLIYGWFFFGVIMMLMFWVGGLFADPMSKQDDSSVNIKGKVSKHSSYLIAGLSFPLFALSWYLVQAIPAADLPQTTKQTDTSNVSSWGIKFVDAMSRSQYIVHNNIEVFHARYANKQSQGEMISWNNVTHDHDRWTIVETKEILIESKPLMLVHLRNISGLMRSYIYQYKVGDFFTVNTNKAKFMQAWNSLTRQSDFSEVRAISIQGTENFEQTELVLLNSYKNINFNSEANKPMTSSGDRGE